MQKIAAFIKKEPVLSVSFLAAALSCCAVPPDGEYIRYMDFRTLTLLYCLMATVSGLGRAGIFTSLAHGMCARTRTLRGLCAALLLLCFFTSMLVTNDVALITFVPFTASLYAMAGREDKLVWIVVLETAAANLGSMLTPVGNPQNIYLFSKYAMSTGAFFSATAPVCAVSLALLLLLCLGTPAWALGIDFGESPGFDKKTLYLSLAMLAACLLCVFRAIPWYALLPGFIAALLIFDRKLLVEADFLLLLTFVCFFVFAGNLGRTETVERAVRAALGGRELVAGALLSQVISNVPAAVLLSGFTDNGRALLLGTDIGGLGTPVASLASLISLRVYSRTPGAKTGAYLAAFTAANFGLLAVLLIFARLFLL